MPTLQRFDRDGVRWTLQQKLFLCFAFTTTLIGACSSTSRKAGAPGGSASFPLPPPLASRLLGDMKVRDAAAFDRVFEQAMREDPSDATRTWVRYRQAALWSKTDAARSCQVWLDLASEPPAGRPRFPLAVVARLHALETCPPNRPEISALSESLLANRESWLKEAIARAALARAARVGDKTQEMRFSVEVAAIEPLQADQIRLLERARALAKDFSDAAGEENCVRQLERLAPRLIVAPQPDRYLAMADDYRKARDFSKAREYYRRVIEAPNESFSDLDRSRALDGVRMTYKLEQQQDRFLQTTREYARFAKKKLFTNHIGKYVEATIALARALWTDGSRAEADQILAGLEIEVKGKYPLDEILLLRARIAEEAGHLDRAAKRLAQLADTPESKRTPDRALKRKIAWYHAWILRKDARLKEAAERLAKLVMDEEDTPPLAARDHFWLGRTLKDLGDNEGASAQFDWLIANDPLGYYGLLAHRELGRSMPPIAPAATPVQSAAGVLADEEQLVFEWLVAVDETDLGRRFLDQAGVSRRSTFLSNPTSDRTLEALKLYARAGSYQALFARLVELPPETRQAILDRNPELLFPRPWHPIVSEAAEKFSVKPELIFSIMRQESSFNPTARSSADALGLMQLIPEVARLSAEGSDVPYRTHDDLYQPEINIPLGSAHLRQLLRRWDGSFIPLVASYNASERAVLGWLRTRDRRDPLQFIEDIPYEETKSYVKLVMRNFVFYSRMATSRPVPFPEWCLNGLQGFKP